MKAIVFPSKGHNGSTDTQEAGMRKLDRLFNNVEETGDTPFGIYVDEMASVLGASRVYYGIGDDDGVELTDMDNIIVNFDKLFLPQSEDYDTKVDERTTLNMTAILGLLLVESGYEPTYKAMTLTARECLLESIQQWGRVRILDGQCELCACNLEVTRKIQLDRIYSLTGVRERQTHYVAGYENRLCHLCVDELIDRLLRSLRMTDGEYNTEYVTYFQHLMLKKNPDLLEMLIDIATDIEVSTEVPSTFP